MLVDDLMYSPGPDIYYDDGFRNVLEDHMTYLRTSAVTKNVEVDVLSSYKYQADLFGYLYLRNIPAFLHWVVMRMNRMTEPMEFGPSITTLLLPDPNMIEQIRQSHQMSRRVN